MKASAFKDADRCAQVGPRGGRCRRLQQYALDFCKKHGQDILRGKSLFCLKCNEVVERKEKSNV